MKKEVNISKNNLVPHNCTLTFFYSEWHEESIHAVKKKNHTVTFEKRVQFEIASMHFTSHYVWVKLSVQNYSVQFFSIFNSNQVIVIYIYIIVIHLYNYRIYNISKYNTPSVCYAYVSVFYPEFYTFCFYNNVS